MNLQTFRERKYVSADRKYVSANKKYVYTERKYVSSAKTKYGASTVKRQSLRREIIKKPLVREIVKRPVLYGKSDPKDDVPAKKVTPQKPEAPKATESAPKTTTAIVAPVKKVDEKKPVEAPSVEPTRDGHYELSPLVSRMVEVELQDVMMKIKNLLPEDARDADLLVAEKFRNKAGDDLKNTLGLNITKRLLNVHNPLYVKMVFSGKPLRADLVNFIKEYNITAFKRVGERGGTFAAKMRSFQDFDDLCTDKSLKCGKVRVTVTPCYQFLTCPQNLRTCYDGKRNNTVTKNNENNVAKNKPVPNSRQQIKDNIPTNKHETTETRQNIKPTESQEATQTVDMDTSVQLKTASANKQNVTSKVTPTKPNESPTSKVASKVETKAHQSGSVNKVAPKVISANTIAAATENKQVAAKTIQAVTQKHNPAPNVTPAKLNQTAAEKQSSAPKTTPTKPSTANKTAAQNQPATADDQNATLKATPAKSTPVAQKQNTASIVTPAKPATANNQNTATTPTKPATATNQSTVTKATPTKPATTNNQNAATKTTPTKPATATGQNTPIKATLTKPATVTDQNTATKATPTKQPAANNTTTKATPTKPATASKPNTAKVPDKSKQPGTSSKLNAASKGIPAKPAATKPKQISPKKKKESDFDELDDHDILALISEGIVLDECSGSEED